MSFISYSSVVVKNISENLIESVDVWFYLSTSSTSLSGGNWLSTPPTWEDGKYFWQKTITTFKDGSTSETDPICITGAKGETGNTGQGVSSITPQYYLSTSKTTPTGGSWSTTQPSWESGKYVWTRTKIVYKNPNSTVYTTAICDTTWEAMQSQIDTVKESVQSVKLQVDENTKTISAKASQSDIEDAINNYDSTTVKTIRDTVAEHKTSIGNITSKVSEVETTVKGKADGSTVDTLFKKVTTMEQDASSFKATVEETYATKSELENTSSTIKSEWTQKAGEIEQKVSSTDGKVSTLTTNLSGVTQRVTDAEGNVKTLTSDLSGITQRVEDAEGNISDIQTDVGGLKTEIISARGGKASLKLKVDELSTNISNASGVASSAKQTAESVQTEITNAKGDSTTLKARLEGIETEISNVESNSKSYTNQTANEIKSTVSQTYTTKTEAIVKVDTEYYLSTSTTTQSGGSWSTTAPQWVDGKYMWSRNVITYGDGNTSVTNPTCIAGAKGTSGKGVSSIVEQYYLSTSTTSQTGGSWSTTVPTWESGKYMWTRSVITYTDNSSVTTNPVCVTGAKGATGADGKGIKSTAITYQAGTSGTTAPTGTWSTSIPTVTKGQYLWSRTIITYTDSTTSTSYSVAYIPTNGATGATGTGVSAIAQQYYLSTSKTSQTGGSWVTTMPTWSSGKYLWTRYAITYKNPASTAYTSPICDSSWEAVNEVQIGGRNLQLGSKNWDTTAWFYKNNVSIDGEIAYMSSVSHPKCSVIPVEINKEYTISIDVKADVTEEITPSGGIVLLDYFDSSNTRITTEWVPGKLTSQWQRVSYTFIVPNVSTIVGLSIGLRNTEGIERVYFKHLKLEIGNKATDWTPAPEDMATADSLTEVNNNLTDSVNNIQSGLNSTNESVTNLENTQNETIKIVSENSEQITNLIQRADGFTMEFETVNETVKQINDEFVTERDERYKYIKFIDGEIWLGQEVEQGDDDFKLVIRNDRISFLQNNIEVAYISDNKLYITDAEITNSLKIGRFVWKIRSNGNMGVIWE